MSVEKPKEQLTPATVTAIRESFHEIAGPKGFVVIRTFEDLKGFREDIDARVAGKAGQNRDAELS